VSGETGAQVGAGISRRALIGGVAAAGMAAAGASALAESIGVGTAAASAKPKPSVPLVRESGGLAVVGTLRDPAHSGTAIEAPEYRAVLTFSAAKGSFTKTLPDAAKCPGSELWLFRASNDTSSNIVYFEAHSGQTIDGTATRIGLAAAGHFFKLWSDGTAWRVADMTATLFEQTFNAGKLGPSSTYTVGNKAPANPNPNDYWFNPNLGVWATVKDGSWLTQGIWQGAQISALTVSGTSATLTLAGPITPVNLPLAPGGSLRIGAARGSGVTGGPYEITAVDEGGGGAPVVTVSGLTANAIYGGRGVAVLCGDNGVVDVWPAPVDLGTNALLANVVVPPSGRLVFELVWGGLATAGDSGWPQAFDVGNDRYLTDGQNSVVGGGLNVARWPSLQVASSSGASNAGTLVNFIPGSHFQFKPVWKLWNKAPDGHMILQDNALQHFAIRAVR